MKNLGEAQFRCPPVFLPASLDSDSKGLFSMQCNQMTAERSVKWKETQTFCRQMQTNDHRNTNQFPKAITGRHGDAKTTKTHKQLQENTQKVSHCQELGPLVHSKVVFGLLSGHFSPCGSFQTSHFKIRSAEFYGNTQQRPHMQGHQ